MKFYEVSNCIVETIFATLSIIEIFRSQLVCKNWRSTIRSPTFLSAFNEVENRSPWFLMNATDGSVNYVYDTEVGSWHKCDISIPEGRIPIASSGSLMCLLSGQGTTSVSNPFTGTLRNVPKIIINKYVEVVAMWGAKSDFQLFVVARKLFGLTVEIYSSTEDTWKEFQLSEQQLVGDTEPANSDFYKWSIYRENAGLTTVNSEGHVMVYYMNGKCHLVKCDVNQCIAYVYPKLPIPDYIACSFDVVECGGRILIVVLKEDDAAAADGCFDGSLAYVPASQNEDINPDIEFALDTLNPTMMLELYEFKHDENEWITVAEKPVLMTGLYPNLPPDIKASGSGNTVMVCVAWEECGIYEVINYNLVNDVCERLPPCIDRDTGKTTDFNRAFSIVPDIKFDV